MPPKKSRKKQEPTAKRKLDLDPKTPPARPTTRASEPDDVHLIESPAKKRGADTVFDKKSQPALVTPPKKETAREIKRRKVEQEKEYVPTYIHKNVEYRRKGQTKDNNLVATFKLVEKHYEIPGDFENNRKYGPLSGVSFEERAISAYSLGLLEPKAGESVAICSACAEEGHKRSACPKLI